MTGQYCYLEPLLIKKHVNALYEALCLGQTDDHWTYLPFGPFLSFNEFNLWLEEMALHKMFYVIFDAQDKQAKGVTSFHDIDTTHGVIEVGAVIYSDALKRTRAATEVMYLMMSHVFDDLQYRRYQWRCNALNTGLSPIKRGI